MPAARRWWHTHRTPRHFPSSPSFPCLRMVVFRPRCLYLGPLEEEDEEEETAMKLSPTNNWYNPRHTARWLALSFLSEVCRFASRRAGIDKRSLFLPNRRLITAKTRRFIRSKRGLLERNRWNAFYGAERRRWGTHSVIRGAAGRWRGRG